ncbi:MAG: cobalt ECF transporter T component CbiQ [Lachnospiraceae bacterium]|nr:cobalt ECF transporter T component CbiQ [Lachnospiraceae bacterium]
MNRLEESLGELRGMEELAAQDSPVHRLHPGVKLILAVACILTVISFSKYQLSAMVPMALPVILAYQIAGIRPSLCFYRLRFVLPLVCFVGLFNPFFDRTPVLTIGAVTVTGGVISMLTLLLKGVLTLMTAFLLVATTRFDRICAALRRAHFPALLVNLLLLTYRYASVLMEEAASMTTAYHLRAPGQKGIHVSAWGSFLGQLLLRSFDRAERLHKSMLLRGYHGHFHYVDASPVTTKDVTVCVCGLALFAFLRFVDITRLLGGLFVR